VARDLTKMTRNGQVILTNTYPPRYLKSLACTYKIKLTLAEIFLICQEVSNPDLKEKLQKEEKLS